MKKEYSHEAKKNYEKLLRRKNIIGDSLPKRVNDAKKVVEKLPESTFNNTKYACPKCGIKKCYTTTRQVKSQDEGMSNIAICICGKEWILN